MLMARLGLILSRLAPLGLEDKADDGSILMVVVSGLNASNKRMAILPVAGTSRC